MLRPLEEMIGIDRLARGLYWGRPWGLVQGCTPVSEGCDHCWSAGLARRFGEGKNPKAAHVGLSQDGHFTGVVRLSMNKLETPLHAREPAVWAIWNDLFHESVPASFIERVLGVIWNCSDDIFIILTKRPAIASEHLMKDKRFCDPLDALLGARLWPPPNVWFGTTIENQAMADRRLAHFLPIPAPVKFVSIEPMLSLINYEQALYGMGHLPETEGWGIQWAVLGAESGADHRPCPQSWLIRMVKQFERAAIPTFVKQIHINGQVNKRLAEWPAELQHRDLPLNTFRWTGGDDGQK